MMGVERHSMVMSPNERKLTAYHEAGHAIVGLTVTDHDPVYKVSIIPRAQALGITMFLPEQDRYSYSKKRLESSITSLFGGRIAEELIFGADAVTTGASNDIKRATEIARNMVTKWGLSERLGPLTYSEDEGEVFLGHSVSTRKEVASTTASVIDEEIRKIIDKNYGRAKEILVEKESILHKMAEALLKYETIDANQLADLMAVKTPREPDGWSTPSNDEPTPPSAKEPKTTTGPDSEKRSIDDAGTANSH
jgi:cell division protease FtsH